MFVLGLLFKALPLSLRVPVPCDYLRRQIPRACCTLRPLDLNILGQKVKKRSTISVGKSWWDCGLHTWVPGFHGT